MYTTKIILQVGIGGVDGSFRVALNNLSWQQDFATTAMDDSSAQVQHFSFYLSRVQRGNNEFKHHIALIIMTLLGGKLPNGAGR